MGNGTFNLLISLLPARVIKLLGETLPRSLSYVSESIFHETHERFSQSSLDFRGINRTVYRT